MRAAMTLASARLFSATLDVPDATLPLDVYGFQVPMAHVLAFHRVRVSTGRDGPMWLSQWNALMRRTGLDGTLPAEAAQLARSKYGRVRAPFWAAISAS